MDRSATLALALSGLAVSAAARLSVESPSGEVAPVAVVQEQSPGRPSVLAHVGLDGRDLDSICRVFVFEERTRLLADGPGGVEIPVESGVYDLIAICRSSPEEAYESWRRAGLAEVEVGDGGWEGEIDLELDGL